MELVVRSLGQVVAEHGATPQRHHGAITSAWLAGRDIWWVPTAGLQEQQQEQQEQQQQDVAAGQAAGAQTVTDHAMEVALGGGT